MWIYEISAHKHPGCWASDTSLQFANTHFFLCLEGYDRSYYEVNAIFYKNKDLVQARTLTRIVGTISQHELFDTANEIPYPYINATLYSIRIHDSGYTEGLIRPVLYEKDAELPQFQRMQVLNGKETIYAIFHSTQAKDAVQKTLNDRIGSNLVEFRLLKENARNDDVKKYIPSYFDLILPSELRHLWDSILEDLVSKRWDRKTEDRWRKFIKVVSEKYPWLVKWIVKILAKFFGIPLPDP